MHFRTVSLDLVTLGLNPEASLCFMSSDLMHVAQVFHKNTFPFYLYLLFGASLICTVLGFSKPVLVMSCYF